MEEMIKTVEGLLKQLQAEPYTPYRDASIGALQTFLANAPQHQACLDPIASKANQPEPKSSAGRAK